MQKLAILASGLALLVGLWVTWTKVATAQVHSNDPKVAMVDNCDPPSGLARARRRRTNTIQPLRSLLGCCSLRWPRTSSDIQRGILHLGISRPGQNRPCELRTLAAKTTPLLK